MRTALFVFVALFLSPAARADDAADAKAIIEKAIKARGDKPGGKPGVTTWKEKITLDAAVVGDQKLEFDTVWTFQAPDKLRLEGTLALMGNNFELVMIANGEKAWFLLNGQLQENPDGQLTLMLTEMNRMWASSLNPLLADDEFKLATAKEKMVNGKPAAGVAVRNGKRPVVTLYFDKETHLLVKREAMVKDVSTGDQEVLEEVVVSDYKKADGRQFHTKVVVIRDGKPYYHSEVSIPKIVEKPDPKLFEKP